MKRTPRAVMNCNKKSATAVFTRGGDVKAGMTTSAAMFPGTAAAIAALGTDLTQLGTYIGTARGNSVIKSLRDVLALKIYGELQLLLAPVNIAAAGNVATIGLSGFACSADAVLQTIPNQVIINKAVQWKTELSAKIFIESLKQPRLTYIVRTTTVAGAGVNDPSWVTVLQTPSSKKLIVPGLIKNQQIYISVNASSTHGIGTFSDPMSFTAL